MTLTKEEFAEKIFKEIRKNISYIFSDAEAEFIKKTIIIIYEKGIERGKMGRMGL